MAIFQSYIGTYTAKGSVGIEHMAFDSDSGSFALVSETAAANPSYLAKSPDGKFLYAALEAPVFPDKSGAIAVYAIGGDGGLTFLQQVPTVGLPCHVLVHPSGKALYAANYVGGSLCAFPINGDGTLGERVFIQHTGHGTDPVRQEAPHCHQCFLVKVAMGEMLVVCDLGLDALVVYPLLPDRLPMPRPIQSMPIPQGYGPRHAVVTEDGYLYCVCELTNRLITFRLLENGAARIGDELTIPKDYVGDSACAALRLSADQRFLYLTNRFSDTVAVYARGLGGYPQLIQRIPTGGKNPRDCTLSPDGKCLAIAHQNEGGLTVFRVDSQTGLLSPLPVSFDMSMPVAVLF